jgi:hypothetical protein
LVVLAFDFIRLEYLCVPGELCHLPCVGSSSDWDSLQLYQPWVPITCG